MAEKLLPIIQIKNKITYPEIEVSFNIVKEKSIEACKYAMNNDEILGYILCVTLKEINETGQEIYYEHGTLCKILRLVQVKPSEFKVVLYPEFVVKILSYEPNELFTQARFIQLYDLMTNENDVVTSLQKILPKAKKLDKEFPSLKNLNGSKLAYLIANSLTKVSIESKEKVLEELDIKNRLEIVNDLLDEELLNIEIDRNINQKVNQTLNDNQRDYILREKLKAIKEELGDISSKSDDVAKMREMLKNNPYPEHIRARIQEEIDHFEGLPQQSAEYTVIRTYLDWMFKIPWYEKTEDEQDITKVEQVLNDDHYGLDKAKNRILQYIAVKQL
ncbi:MAG: LON peptidase substrate-binding domain-containing protein, partial [Bacillales bacterium]|nr:LON peptidase substrate-binding domain-containing protein [Bacillales bacterium]